jgi:hypothetical protein
MIFMFSANVQSSDGENAGKLHRVVIDPKTLDFTHIVVQSGLLVKTDHVIPAENLASTSPDQIVLTCSVEEIKEMPSLEIEDYSTVNEIVTHKQTTDPLSGSVYGHPSIEPSLVKEIKRTIPDHLVAVKESAEVIANNDAPVARIEGVHVESGKVLLYVISQGLLLKTMRSFPAEWVEVLGEEQVHLNVGEHALEELPEYPG